MSTPFRSRRKPANTNPILIARLTDLMMRQDTNPCEVAEKAGLGFTAVYDIVYGRVKQPRSDTLDAIADVLNVSVAYLTGASAKRG
jgi:transcriptional regulator with XRE-family HTH domain